MSDKKIAVAGNPTVLAAAAANDLAALLSSLRQAIQAARQQALRAVDLVQVQTCWAVGRHIVEFEQGGASRAAYGKRLLPDLAVHLTAEFGQQLLLAGHADTQCQIDGFRPHSACITGFDMDTVQVNDGVQRIQWTGLPGFGIVHYRICYRRD